MCHLWSFMWQNVVFKSVLLSIKECVIVYYSRHEIKFTNSCFNAYVVST